MKIYNTLFLIGALLLSSCATAQPGRYLTKNKGAIKQYEKAMEAFRTIDINGKPDIENARKYLEKALKKDENFPEALRLSGVVERQAGNDSMAYVYFNRALGSHPMISPSGVLLFEMAELAMNNGWYEKCLQSAERFVKFKNANPEMVQKAKMMIVNSKFGIQAKKNPSDFEPFNIGPGVNTEMPEYFPTITTDDKTLLFTRVVEDPNLPRGAQEDFFVSELTPDFRWGAAYPFSRRINTSFNEGAPSFNPDGMSLVFVACEDPYISGPVYKRYGKDRGGYGSCDLFITRKIGDEWSQPKNLSPNVNTQHWETQPSVSSDGRSIYFIRGVKRADRSGKQDQDIYVTNLQDDGSWSEAERLPSTVNSPGKEESVQIHPDGQTLYFSSDGRVGMGGTDIYMSRKQEDGSWGPAINLGYPINTHTNENSILVSSKGNIAFFASDREGGYGSLDIYSFELPKKYRPLLTTYMKGKVYDKETKKPLGAEFDLIDLKTGKTIIHSKSDEQNGQFLVSIPTNRNYALKVDKDLYAFFSKNFQLMDQENNDEPFYLDVPLTPLKVSEDPIRLDNIFFDLDKYDLREESFIELNKLYEFLSENPSLKIEIHGHTDNQGSDTHNQTLSENRAKAVYEYLVKKGISADRLSHQGFGSKKPVADNETKEGRQENRRTEYIITGI